LETYQRFKRCLAAMGLPVDIFDKLKPSIAAITLELLKMEQAGFNPDYGLDQYLFEHARREAKEILVLEHVDFQIDLLTNESKSQAEFLMRSTLDGLDRKTDSLEQIVNACRTGNSDALEHLFSKGLGQDSALQQRMVTDRNLDWLPRIEDLLTGKKDAVVVVGTGHLVGLTQEERLGSEAAMIGVKLDAVLRVLPHKLFEATGSNSGLASRDKSGDGFND
jgi:hypothetical protein